jgi:hypothetical protein
MGMKVDPKFLEVVSHLSASQKEKLLSRMRGKLPRRLLKDKINTDTALALQLEIEDEQLQDWRKQMLLIKEKSKKITEKKDKAAKQAKTETPPKASTKAKKKSNAVTAAVKAKPVAKAQPVAKAKAATKPTK